MEFSIKDFFIFCAVGALVCYFCLLMDAILKDAINNYLPIFTKIIK